MADSLSGGGWRRARPPTDAASLGATKDLHVLAIDADEHTIAPFEIVEYDDDTGERWHKPVREWIVPADVLNRCPVIDLGSAWDLPLPCQTTKGCSLAARRGVDPAAATELTGHSLAVWATSYARSWFVAFGANES